MDYVGFVKHQNFLCGLRLEGSIYVSCGNLAD